MELKIISASDKIFEGTIEKLSVPGGKGEMEVLPSHVGLISTLEAGTVVIAHDGQSSEILVNGGFIQVEGDDILILVEEAVHVDKLVTEEIIEAIKTAEEKKLQGNISESDLIQLEKQLQFEKLKKNAVTKKN